MSRKEEIEKELKDLDPDFPLLKGQVMPDAAYFQDSREQILRQTVQSTSPTATPALWKWSWIGWAAAASVTALVFFFWPRAEDPLLSGFEDEEWTAAVEVLLLEEETTVEDLALLLNEESFAEVRWTETAEDDLELLLDEIGEDMDIEYLTDQIQY